MKDKLLHTGSSQRSTIPDWFMDTYCNKKVLSENYTYMEVNVTCLLCLKKCLTIYTPIVVSPIEEIQERYDDLKKQKKLQKDMKRLLK